MILIVDDDESVRASLSFLLKRSGYEAIAVPTPEEAVAQVRSTEPEAILMDMNYSLSITGEEGLELLRKIRILAPSSPVILMTAWGSIPLAVEGMRIGAFDFITKPWDNFSLLERIRTAVELNRSREPDTETAAHREGFDKIIGKSNILREVLDAVSMVAPTGASVLITGESGTGKELIAEAIHLNSPRSGHPFIKVNLGGLSPTLFDSEMFGHRKGAFTDAFTDRKGRFELADKGTIFLDEIGELDPVCQVKLLRVLQDRTYEPLGDSRPRKADVRVISATNRNLAGMVSGGTFREDLYYRINLIPIHLPALRERRGDIPLLVRHFADAVRPGAEFSPEAMEYLCRLPWPGNIRELKNLTERVIILSGNRRIEKSDIEKYCTPEGNMQAGGREEDLHTADKTLQEMEKERVIRALDECKGNITRASASLGISRAALYRKIDKFGIEIQ